ncbi:MAG: [FeFe] hydrogenase H-cluster radical SAM maturase HydE [Treponema sp.]|nr:[FeFe] hydrogenase H-cluster radical SAM maturase HydE [Treponema sp.]
MLALIEKLKRERILEREEFRALLSGADARADDRLRELARETARENFSNEIYVRGLIEFSNYCQRNCLYCALRAANRAVERYRMEKDEILECCERGRELGFRSFVMQSGEDNYYTAEKMTEIIAAIRARHPDCAITLSVGEKDEETYRAYFKAGANRFLLRHETISPEHYRKLHPPGMELAPRVECLRALKRTGFQTGSGIMVGSPFQTIDNIIDDLYFLAELRPEMIGIGPYLPSRDTPFAGEKPGSAEDTVRLIAILRLMRPDALIPATTALATAEDDGRERGILAGANVVMPNLSPAGAREKYRPYDNKAGRGAEAAEGLELLRARLAKIGYAISAERGDHAEFIEGGRCQKT